MDARIIANEMRTPLNALLLSVQCAQSSLQDPAILRLLAISEKNAQTLSGMIESLLTAGETGRKEPLNRRECTASGLVNAAVGQILPLAEAKSQTLEIAALPTLPSFLADEDRLDKVLINLLSNAVKFTPVGGHVHVTVSLRSNDGHFAAIFSVIDDGQGVADADIHRIFSPRANSALAGSFSGSIGLAVCREYVETHGGRIWLETGRERGSAFSFSVPLDPGSFPQSGKDPAPAQQPQSDGKEKLKFQFRPGSNR